MAEERIQKIMSEQGLCSRRAAEQIIAEGRVKVNGHPVKVGDKMDPNRDVLQWQAVCCNWSSLFLHKPL